jgi:hypothetical protein
MSFSNNVTLSQPHNVLSSSNIVIPASTKNDECRSIMDNIVRQNELDHGKTLANRCLHLPAITKINSAHHNDKEDYDLAERG